MKSYKYLLALCLCLALVFEHSSGQFCGPNEVFTGCVNPCNNCFDRGFCPGPCYPGCDCSSGTTRNSAGQCVIPAFCDSGMGSSDFFVEGSGGCNRHACHRSCRRRGYNGGNCHRGSCDCYY